METNLSTMQLTSKLRLQRMFRILRRFVACVGKAACVPFELRSSCSALSQINQLEYECFLLVSVVSVFQTTRSLLVTTAVRYAR